MSATASARLARMRKTGICPKCEHQHTLLVDAVADVGEFATEVRPLHVAMISTGERFFGGDKLGAVGKLSAVVCKACGYTELYVQNPGSIPVDGEYVRERGPMPSTGPHR
jgi:predicted nucleic-acid-binding Zn-ribbon protein